MTRHREHPARQCLDEPTFLEFGRGFLTLTPHRLISLCASRSHMGYCVLFRRSRDSVIHALTFLTISLGVNSPVLLSSTVTAASLVPRFTIRTTDFMTF